MDATVAWCRNHLTILLVLGFGGMMLSAVIMDNHTLKK